MINGWHSSNFWIRLIEWEWDSGCPLRASILLNLSILLVGRLMANKFCTLCSVEDISVAFPYKLSHKGYGGLYGYRISMKSDLSWIA